MDQLTLTAASSAFEMYEAMAPSLIILKRPSTLFALRDGCSALDIHLPEMFSQS
jgi:hypothetical protein